MECILMLHTVLLFKVQFPQVIRRPDSPFDTHCVISISFHHQWRVWSEGDELWGSLPSPGSISRLSVLPPAWPVHRVSVLTPDTGGWKQSARRPGHRRIAQWSLAVIIELDCLENDAELKINIHIRAEGCNRDRRVSGEFCWFDSLIGSMWVLKGVHFSCDRKWLLCQHWPKSQINLH